MCCIYFVILLVKYYDLQSFIFIPILSLKCAARHFWQRESMLFVADIYAMCASKTPGRGFECAVYIFVILLVNYYDFQSIIFIPILSLKCAARHFWQREFMLFVSG